MGGCLCAIVSIRSASSSRRSAPSPDKSAYRKLAFGPHSDNPVYQAESNPARSKCLFENHYLEVSEILVDPPVAVEELLRGS